MFILDSLFLSGFRWVLDTVRTAAEAELDDDTALREELLAAEMRREMGEISDEEFAEIETDLLGRIREIKERREGGSGPIAFGADEDATRDAGFQVEATVSGDFHEPQSGDSGTVIEGTLLEAPPRLRAAPRRTTPAAAARQAGRSRPSTTSRTSRRPRSTR
jgi:hypothetical protein